MPLRWSLFGKQVTTNTQKECIYSVNRINIVRNDDLIHNSVKQFWEYEECINANSQETTMPMSNIKCLRKLTRETKFTNGKYEFPMLWKESCEELPDNYQIALQRLKLLQRRFKRNDKLFRMCKKAIDSGINIQRRKLKQKSSYRSGFIKQFRWSVIQVSKLQNCFGCRRGRKVPSGESFKIRYGFSYVPVGKSFFPKSKDRHISDDSTHIWCNRFTLLYELCIKICWQRPSH